MNMADAIGLAVLKAKSDATHDFIGLGDDGDHGKLLMAHDRDVYDCEHGTESKVRAVECIGAIVYGNDDGDYPAPIILSADEAYDRFGLAAIASCEESHLESYSG